MPLEPARDSSAKPLPRPPDGGSFLKVAVVVLALFLLGLPFVYCPSSNFEARSGDFDPPTVGFDKRTVGRMNVKDALVDGARAQRAHRDARGTFTKSQGVITSRGRYSGVDIRAAYADEDAFCLEARHVKAEMVWHITERLDAPRKGGCPAAPR